MRLLRTLLITTFFTLSAFADFGVSITPKVGTLGVGADVAYKFNPYFKARANFNALAFTVSVDTPASTADINASFKTRTFGLLADYHPFKGGLRLSTGLYKVNKGIKFDYAHNEDVEIQGHVYRPSDYGSIKGNVDWKKVAPYIGLGYEGGFGNSTLLGLVFDVGLMRIGKPDVSFEATGAINHPRLKKDLEAEQREKEDEFNKFQWYPVVSLGLVIRF